MDVDRVDGGLRVEELEAAEPVRVV